MNLRDHSPYGVKPSVLQEFRWNMHTWGREAFASNFARGGVTSAFFAATPGEAWSAAWRPALEYGSSEHISNLRRIQKTNPNNLNIADTIKKAELAGKTGKGMFKGMVGKMGGPALNAAFVAYEAYNTPGGATEKSRAAATAGVSFVGFGVGMKVGFASGVTAGVAIGGPVGGVIGGVVGGLGGGIVGGLLAEKGMGGIFSATDNMVERERARRTLDWRRDQSAFNTQKAYTMRQQSLQMMNRGMMNARSILGREAVMLHQ